jgi:hypothetical protein
MPLGRQSTYSIYFSDFKVAKWAISSLTRSTNPFEYCKYIYFNIYDSNIATAEFFMIWAETTA